MGVLRSLCLRSRALALAVSLATGVMPLAVQSSEAEASEPIKIAVFDFELKDVSAGGGIVNQDKVDVESLRKATDEARRLLSASGRYSIVDAAGMGGEVKSAGGIQHCNGCEAGLARKLGADQSMAGIVTRVTRTEYALRIVVRDARTGAVVSDSFTDLRMGANYSWPRGVKWLMDNKVLAPKGAR